MADTALPVGRFPWGSGPALAGSESDLLAELAAAVAVVTPCPDCHPAVGMITTVGTACVAEPLHADSCPLAAPYKRGAR